MKQRSINPELVALAALCGLILLSRAAAISSNNQLNIDESLPMANALRTGSLAPWRSIDSTTSGPVSSWFLWALHQVGVPMNYRSVHLVAAMCLIFVFVASWLASRRFFGVGPALMGAATGAMWLAFLPRKEFSHFSSEIVPISLIGLALLCAVWPKSGKPGQKRLGLVIAGFTLGVVPWAKLQAAPIALVLGLILVAEVLIRPGRAGPGDRRWIDAALMCIAALVPSAFILTWVIAVGAWSDFTKSYIISNLLYASKPGKAYIVDVIYIITRRSIGPLLIGTGALYAAAALVRGAAVLKGLRHHRWELGMAASFLAVSFFVCVKPRTQYDHYQLLLVAPAMLTIAGGVALLVDQENAGAVGGRLSQSWVLAAACLWLPLAIMAMWFAPIVLRDTESMLRPHESFPEHQIAGVVRETVPEIRSVAVWGWEPCIYVDLGLQPVVRHVINHYLDDTGPVAAFLRGRFLDDLRTARPDVILDVATISGPDAHKPELSSTFPELSAMLGEHYNTVRSFEVPATSTDFGREVTIYARRTANGN